MKEVTNEWTVLSMLEWATSHFRKKKVPNPRLSIEWLLAEVLGIKRLDLYLKYDRPLTSDELDRLRPLVQRRTDHEPLQYILGYTEFLNCRLFVDERVLIPRVETEQLLEILLKEQEARKDDKLRVLDIGTGSGCISVALAKERRKWTCYGVDLSRPALELAQKNAQENEVDVTFLEADLFELSTHEAIDRRNFDLIVSNPPYILPGERDALEPQVSSFEPEVALFHEQPLQIYRSISKFAASHLSPEGHLYLECNALLADQILEGVREYFEEARIMLDYDGKKRFLHAAFHP
ncbi:MAG: peptide chain release factor N(5)-glutamine methyltransferase [Balneolaceae bacterium]